MNKHIAFAVALAAASSGAMAQRAATLVIPMQFAGESGTLFDMAAAQASLPVRGLTTPREMIQRHGPLMDVEDPSAPKTNAARVEQATLQTEAVAPFVAVPFANFEGPGVGLAGFTMTGAPPDTTMAVGPNHIVAWVNSMYAIMTKTGTVQLLANGNALFAGTGNICDTTNRGDPILQYDRRADRWVLSQFAFAVNASGSPIAPYAQCVAVSTTNNPLGTYYRYVINFGSTSPEGFNDYGKMGIFDNAYYTSYNIFGGSPAGSNTGAALCASDRNKMLVGDATATTLCAPITFYGGGASLLPMDVDGTAAPTTTAQGNIFIRQSTAPALRMVKLKPDFTAGTVTVSDGVGGAAGTSFINIPITLTRACNGASGSCVRQPGTTTLLDTLGDRLMYRAAYRNRGGTDSLVVTIATDPDGAGARGAAVRWFEIRNPFSATPTLYQNSTFDPGATGDRWMSSAAMDKMGNILMGYSVANVDAGLKPSIAITGRLRTDVRNQMRAEQILVGGTGSQTVRSSGTALTRWGDYTTMQVDPADDCTFWYIGQYLTVDGVFNWQTRIGSYKFNGCS